MRTVRTDAEKAKLYNDRVRRADEALAKWSPAAKRQIARYRIDPEVQTFSVHGHHITVPTGLAIIDSMFSSLTAVDLEILCHPAGLGTQQQARVAEAAITEVWKEAKVSQKTRSAVKEALLVGIGWVKVGYDYAEHDEVQPKDEEELDAEIGDIYRAADEAGELPDPEAVAASVEPDKVVTVVDRDRVVVDHIKWDQVGWDPAAKRYEDMRYIYQITYLTEEEVKGNPVWREYVKKATGNLKALEDLEPDAVADDGRRMTPEQMREVDEDNRRFAIIEYWDLDHHTFCTFARGANFLLNEDTNPFAFNEDREDRNPFVPIVLRTNPDSVRGIADMELIMPQLDELQGYRTTLINYLDKHLPKLYGPDRAFGEKAKQAFQDKNAEFVPLENEYGKNEVGVLEPPPLPQEMFGMVERIENQIREATGVSELMRGIFPDRKRTATETTEVVAASSARQAEKRSLMEDFYVNIAKRILQLVQTYYDEERVSRLVEVEGDVLWEWDAESVTAEMDINVELSPKQLRDRAWREERAMKLVNFVAPLQEAKRLPLIVKALQDMGYSMQEIREVVQTEDEQQVAKQKELQDQANQAVAAEGVPPPPDSVPGPLSGAELAAQANPGEVPPELHPAVADAAELGQSGNGPLDFLVGP